MSETLVHFHSVSFAYHLEPVIRELDWHWRLGENWALLGGNGAGKTTLARLLCDEIRPQRGAIQRAIAPEQIAHLSFDRQRELMERDRRLDMSDLHEDAFDSGTTVREAILQGRLADRHFHQLCEQFQLGGLLERGIRFISTGESRKTLLARALLAAPRLLILDNPLEGLDRVARGEFQALLEQLLASGPPLLLLCNHAADIPPAMDRVMILDSGHLQPTGERTALATDTPASVTPELPAGEPRQAAPPDQPLFALRGVGVNFRGTPILRDIHWTLRPGQHCRISGPNGAGKSTLLGLLTGDNDKAYGQPLELFGQPRGSGESLWDIKARFGTVSTALQLGHLTRLGAAEVVASGFFDSIGLYRDCSPAQRERVIAWLQALQLWPLRQRLFGELSFGEQRLVLLARAMVKSPLILVLDEPCIGLDTRQRQRILATVDRIAARGDTQILYVSHEPDEAPARINQWLELVPAEGGGYTARVSS